MRCIGCGFENLAEANFCEECGAQLVRLRPSCKYELQPKAKFCGNCGAPQETENGSKVERRLSVARFQLSVPNPQPNGGS